MKKILNTKLLVYFLFTFLFLSTHIAQAQFYLVQNFDASFVGSPAAPAGWKQTRIQAIVSNSERDWTRNTVAAGVWQINTGTNRPTVALSGNGALFLEDVGFAATTYAQSERRMESPGLNLTGSNSPYVRFYYYNLQDAGYGLNLRVVVSTDSGATWHTLSNVLNGLSPAVVNNWSRINIPIPARYRTAHTQIGFAYVNRNGVNNIYIDSVSVLEFTPPTVTSNANGAWNVASTWSPAIIPTADHNVVINHTVTLPTPGSSVARCQNLTINATGILNYSAAASYNIQAFGDVTVSGQLNAFNGTNGRQLLVGRNLTVNTGGTINFSVAAQVNNGSSPAAPLSIVANTAGIIFCNSDSASFTNNGTITNNRIQNIWHLGSNDALFTYNSPVNVVYTFGLYSGNVFPNGNLTLGGPPAAVPYHYMHRGIGTFTSAPTFNNTNMTYRWLLYVSPGFVSVEPRNIVSGEENRNSGGRIIEGVLTMNTHNNLNMSYPLTIGNTTYGFLQLTRGIINSSTTNPIIFNTAIVSATSVAPSQISPNPTTHGSYVNGAIRFIRPTTGTQVLTAPLGVGSNFNGTTPSGNSLRTVTITPNTNWSGQSFMVSLEEGNSTTFNVNAPLTSTMSDKVLRIQPLLGDLPNATTINMTGVNYTFGRSDSLIGQQGEFHIAQSANKNGPWSIRSTTTGVVSPFINNTFYTRNTVNTFPGPIAPLNTNGQYFTFATTAPKMVYASAEVIRNTQLVAAGAPNMAMLRVRVHTNGTVPIRISQLVFNTNGTSNVNSIAQAKVYYTGADSNFNTSNAFGNTVNSPSGAFTVLGNSRLNTGANYFWLVYDVAGSALTGDSLAAQCVSVTVDDTVRTLVAPPQGFRRVGNSIAFVNASTEQVEFNKVFRGSVNNQLLRLAILMSDTGAPTPATKFVFRTNGTANPDINLVGAKVFYTGANPNFTTTNLYGQVNNPSDTFEITGATNLANGINYFWLTYDVSASANLTDSLDAEFLAVEISQVNRIPINTSAPGNRKIKEGYCTPTYSFGCSADFISRVRLNTIDNTTTCNANGAYTHFSNIPAPVLLAGQTHTLTLNFNNENNQFARAWIDYNDDGDFTDAGEDLGITTPANAATNGMQSSITFTIPCSAVSGLTRLRIRGGDDVQPQANQSCGASSNIYGEAEDYNIQLVGGAREHIATTAIQQTGGVPAPTNNVPVLRVPIKVKVTPCSGGVITQLRFRTTGTTNTANILNAKLYKTGSSNQFSVNNLLGTVVSPNGSFSFVINDSAVYDTNNYWLTYDLVSGAPNGNLLDAVLDSVQVFGVWYSPVNGNPAGAKTVATPMIFLNANAAHSTFERVERGTLVNPVLRVMVTTTSFGAPVDVSQFTFSTNGSNNTIFNIDSITVWYTGANPEFSSPVFFGGVGTRTGTFTVDGIQSILNDTNYFWVSYGVPPLASIGDSLDAQAISLVINGAPQPIAAGNPIGSRIIRAAYCASFAVGETDAEIQNVTVGSFSNASDCNSTGGPGSLLNLYSNYTNTIAPPKFIMGKTYPFSVHTSTCDGSFDGVLGIWIDLNLDGDFNDAGENVHMSQVFTYGPSSFRTGNITLPCSPIQGLTRMRVVLQDGGTTPIPACGAYGFGETEDYLVELVNQPSAYVSTTPTQPSGTVPFGATNALIMHVPVIADANTCQPGVITRMRFSTTGTTVDSNIAAARLFRTGNSPVFATTNPVATVLNPNGTFAFHFNDTALDGTNHYWLAYDISSTAPNANIVDARLDSLVALGGVRVPTNTTPSGSLSITAPMTYLSSEATHPTLTNISKGSTLNQMLRMQVVTSTAGAPIPITAFTLSMNGTDNPTTNIDSIIIWSTGNNPNFVSPQFYGGVGARSGVYTISGLMNLLNDTNYFWLTYNVPQAANVSDSLDAQINSITINGIARIPSVTNPAGRRRIKGVYCIPVMTSGCTVDQIDLVATVGAVSNLTNVSSGCNGNPNAYQFNTMQTLVVQQGAAFTLQLRADGDQEGLAAWIDYNDDGDFDDANEFVATFAPSLGVIQSRQIIVPLQTVTGATRMRVRAIYNINIAASQSCSAETWGETEDFQVSILPAPIPTVYVWNQTSPASFVTAANWTPSRSVLNLNDKLVFPQSGIVVVNDVPTQTVATLTLNANSELRLSSTTPQTLTVTDTLNWNGKITNDTTLSLVIGSPTIKGYLPGNGVVNGIFGRWIQPVTDTYHFPISTADTNASVFVNFTTAPTSAGVISAQFKSALPTATGLPIQDSSINLNRIAQDGWWRMLSSQGLSGGVYNLTLRADSFVGVYNVSQMSMVYRSDANQPWTTAGFFLTPTGNFRSVYARRTGLTVFGDFALAGDSVSNPLPVSMFSFDAFAKVNDAVVYWVTASEVNNKGFYIERSLDGINFEKITFIAAQGNASSSRSYQYTDARILEKYNTVYYRLRQVDLDGTYTLSKVVLLNKQQNKNGNVRVTPNPFVTDVTVQVVLTEDEFVTIEIADMQGRSIYTTQLNLQQGVHTIRIPEMESLQSGVYVLKVRGTAENSFKIIKTRG